MPSIATKTSMSGSSSMIVIEIKALNKKNLRVENHLPSPNI